MKSHQVVSSYFLTKNNWLFNLFSCLLKNLLNFLFMSQRFEGGSQRFEGGKSNLDISLMKSPEMSLETRIAELVSGILRSLEKALDKSDELDVGTIKHSLGTAVLALVLIAKLIENSAGELRGAQAVTTGDQQSEVPATEKIKEFWSWLNEYLRGGSSSSSQTEVSKTPESRVLELWNTLLRYLPLFLVFLLLHDYGKRFISDIVNSEVRFSDAQKKLAQQVLDELIRKSSNREALNRQFLPSSPDEVPNYLRQQLLSLFGIWTLEGMKAVLLSLPASEANFPTGQESNNLRQEVESLLVQFIKNPRVNQRELVPITQVAETDPQMAASWSLIMTHPAHGFLDVAETIINQLKQSNYLSPEDKAYITAIAVGVIAGHHTPGGNSGYPPVDVLVKVLKHCLEHLGLDVDSNYLEQAKNLMLFAAAFAKIIDVMQARCFDERAYNQNTTRPLPTKLQFESQTSDTGDTELQKRMNDFLRFLDNWICEEIFPGLNNLNFDDHSTVSAYYSIYKAILNQRIPDSEQSLASASNPTRINYGSIINDLSLTLGILSR
jgi:hypothetical protein